MSKLNDFINAILVQSQAISVKKEYSKKSLDELLVDSIHVTMKEIKNGSDPDEFSDLTIIDFIIAADKEGYSEDSIREYIKSIKE